MKKHTVIFFIAVCFLFFYTQIIAAVGKKEVESDIIEVGFSFGAEWLDIYQAMEDMFLQAIDDYNQPINVQFWYADGDVDREASNIKKAIASDIDLLILMPQNSRTILHSIELAHQKGIPVVVYNRQQDPHPTIIPEAYVGLDTYDQAYTTSVALFKRMKEDGIPIRVVIVLGDMVDRNAINRRKGFMQAVEEFDAAVVAEIESNWNAEEAAAGLANLLRQGTVFNAIFLSSDFIIPEVRKVLLKYNAWYPYGHPNHLYLGTQDAFKEAIPDIRQGYIDVTTAFDIHPMSVTLVQVVRTVASSVMPGQEVFLVPGRVLSAFNINEIDDLWSLRN